MASIPDPASSRLVTPLTVLLVEGSELDAALVGEMLRHARGIGATVIRRDRLDQALAWLARGGVDLVLLDLSLPDSRGLETFEQVRTAAPDVPIIVMSSFQDEDLAVTVVRNGGQDYNRRGFISLATSHLEPGHRGGRRFVLLYADLDGLKQINDTYGHREGDLAIIKAADVLRNTFRTSDIVARRGGDEFVVLAVEAAGYFEDLLVTRLEQHLAEFNRRTRLPYALGMSAGVSGYEFTSPLWKRARRALRSRELAGQA